MNLAVRAVLALVLMTLYIVLAIGAVLGLVWLGKQCFSVLSMTDGRGMLVMLLLGSASFAAAAVIVWSMFPRRDKFEPPGPELFEADQPALFEEIRTIATSTTERMPRHVYVMWALNAFVAQRGGMMGFGSQRVMGIGLPLMRALSISELRAVLAHEMGHFYGGDTRLGPWIYKTRGAIGRTIINLARAGGAASFTDVTKIVFEVVLAPFRWFGRAFLRVTQAISRAQELAADRVAARCAGTDAVASGLKKTHAASVAYQAYMGQEVMPMLSQGVLPPVGEGFSRFLDTSHVARLLDEVVGSELREGTRDPYDSHPPLRERLAALETVTARPTAVDARPAIALLADAERIESELIASNVTRPLARIRWEDAATHWIARWRSQRGELARHLRQLTVATLPSDARGCYQLALQIEGRGFADRVDDDTLLDWGVGTFGAVLCSLLVDAGYSAETRLGEAVVLRKDDVAIEPFVELRQLVSGEVSRDAWRDTWTALGLADKSLGPS